MKISEIAGIKKERIAVIYNCVDMAKPQLLEKESLEKKYILNVFYIIFNFLNKASISGFCILSSSSGKLKNIFIFAS